MAAKAEIEAEVAKWEAIGDVDLQKKVNIEHILDKGKKGKTDWPRTKGAARM